MNILITGGAGFVGSRLALALKNENPSSRIVAFDNLRRRGSEINLALFREHGVEFVHGDIRHESDLADIAGNFDVMLEASAEPSVLAGLDGSPSYVLQTNLTGTLNCLEFARKRTGGLIFLSTSRVYSIEPLKNIHLIESETRFHIAEEQNFQGISPAGITETFPTHLPRSLYGATKLASELIIQEYVASLGLQAVINRCGVIAGPGQFGKVDQGVFTLWVARHYFRKPLTYTGFGGQGKQVRDLLHPDDLLALIQLQIAQLNRCSGGIYNVGGGLEVSTSLQELTGICQEVTGNQTQLTSEQATATVDIPLYISDSSFAQTVFGWKPARKVRDIVEDITCWLKNNEAKLREVF